MNMQRKSPTAADLDAIYGSRFYNGSNLGANRPVLTIVRVGVEELRGKNGPELKALLHFKESTKLVALNKTNKAALEKVLGIEPEKWIGATIRLWADDANTFEDKPHLRLEVLKAP